MSDWQSRLERWVSAGVIDAATGERIRDFEARHGGALQPERATRWPVIIAITFGCVMVGAGVLLFVAAHWDELSPGARFSLVLAMVAAFHLAGAAFWGRNDMLATALHGVGTASLGAGIFLAGQIFNLQEHWPSGVLLWALGAVAGWWLLRDWVQGALAAILVPWWIAGEWQARVVETHHRGEAIGAGFLLMVAIVYFGAVHGRQNPAFRRALMWIGGLAFIPLVLWLTFAASEETKRWWWRGGRTDLSGALQALGWVLAVLLPILLAYALRRKAAVLHLLSAVWVGGLAALSLRADPEDNPLFFLWCMLGAVAMIAWGVREGRKERINLGMASFALTVLGFYFSRVLDKFGRSTALISMGLIFLVGGWYLEKTRRRLIARISEPDETGVRG